MSKKTKIRSRAQIHASKETNEKGFIMVLMLLFALSILAVKMADLYMEETRASITVRTDDVPTKIKKIKDAITAFAIVNKRLPCPAQAFSNVTTSSPYLTANYDEEKHGKEASGNASCQQFSGTVPWASLGLSAEDVVDGWGNRISYHVFADIDVVASNTIIFDPTAKETFTNNYHELPGLVDAFQVICQNKHSTDNPCPFGYGFKICAEPDGADANADCDTLRQAGVAFALISHGEMSYDAISSEGGIRIRHAGVGFVNEDDIPKNRNSILFKLKHPYDSTAEAGGSPMQEAQEIYDMEFDAGGYPVENPDSDTRYDDIVAYMTFEDLFSAIRVAEQPIPDYCTDMSVAIDGIRIDYDYTTNNNTGSDDYPSVGCINELITCYQTHFSGTIDFDSWNTASCALPANCVTGPPDFSVYWPDHSTISERRNWLKKCPWDVSSGSY